MAYLMVGRAATIRLRVSLSPGDEGRERAYSRVCDVLLFVLTVRSACDVGPKSRLLLLGQLGDTGQSLHHELNPMVISLGKERTR